MARIDGVDPGLSQGSVRRLFDAQTNRWGAPLLPYRVYARRPSILAGVRGMWAGLDESGLLEVRLVSLVNRRVAAIIGCLF